MSLYYRSRHSLDPVGWVRSCRSLDRATPPFLSRYASIIVDISDIRSAWCLRRLHSYYIYVVSSGLATGPVGPSTDYVIVLRYRCSILRILQLVSISVSVMFEHAHRYLVSGLYVGYIYDQVVVQASSLSFSATANNLTFLCRLQRHTAY